MSQGAYLCDALNVYYAVLSLQAIFGIEWLAKGEREAAASEGKKAGGDVL